MGMPVAEAAALTTAHFEQHDPAADHAALLQLAGWCEQFSPIVGVEPPDNLLFDVTGLDSLFGSDAALVEQIERAFHYYRLTTRIALADTISAAWALAHYAKESSALAPPGNIDSLSELPLAALRLPPAMVETLSELGIQTIGQLLALPREALAARFDPQLFVRLDQALGIVPETIHSHRPPPEIVVETSLEFPTVTRAEVDYLLLDLLEKVCAMLIERQQGAVQLECRLQCDSRKSNVSVDSQPKTPVKILIGLYCPSANSRHLLELARLQLDRLALPGPISRIELSVLTAAPLIAYQQDLFAESSSQENGRHLAVLVDRLSNRLGRESVVRAKPLADAQPEFAVRYEPLAGVLNRRTINKKVPRRQKAKKKNAAANQQEIEQNNPPLRPLQLQTEPLALEVVSVVPDGPPIHFNLHGAQHRVAQTWGPERIQTGWWRGQYIQRDYYRVETTVGIRFWLFRRLQDQKWFLHGVFD
jgi:protein ImuB